MPALEIMPQCAAMDDIRKFVSKGKVANSAAYPQHAPNRQESSGCSSAAISDMPIKDVTQADASSKIVRFMRRRVENWRQCFYDNRMNKATIQSNVTKQTTEEKKDIFDTTFSELSATSESEELYGSISSIAVRYMPKIQENEEEEPPELLGNSSH